MISNNLPTTPIISTTLRVMGNFEPELLTAELGIDPTRYWRKGDPRGGSPVLRFAEDGWALQVNKRPSLHLEEELSVALALLRPRAARFKDALRMRSLRAQLCFGVEVDGLQYPSISLRAEEIAEVADLGVSIDIDIV
jgi:hypothetical protein